VVSEVLITTLGPVLYQYNNVNFLEFETTIIIPVNYEIGKTLPSKDYINFNFLLPMGSLIYVFHFVIISVLFISISSTMENNQKYGSSLLSKREKMMSLCFNLGQLSRFTYLPELQLVIFTEVHNYRHVTI
jgi:hypothetical protein